MSALADCQLMRHRLAVATLLVLGWLAGALVGAAGSVGAQAPTPTPQGTGAATAPESTCPKPGSAAFMATASSESPYYDYAILLDVSGSMKGIYSGQYLPEKDIFDEVKASLKGYVSELQPGSMVHIIPFGNRVDPARVRQFGIEEPSAPDGGEQEALDYIDNLAADNDETRITESVNYALDMLDSLRDDDREHIQTILLYTDGIGNGDGDVDADGNAIVDNLVGALSDYRREQPYLFVKYVALGVEVPGAEILEENGVEVVESIDVVPPVREVRLAVVPADLGALAPGVPVSNRLCAASGDLEGGVAVSVNDDPAELPEDVQVAFRSGGSTLDDAGIPLDYTLAGLPASGEGPFTTYVEVRSENPEFFLIPGRLPVTFSTADPTPAATLAFGAFAEQTVIRGADEADVAWTLPLDLQAPDGGAVALHIDRSRLDDSLPQAVLGLRIGTDSPREAIELNGDQARAELVLSASPADLATFADGPHSIPVDVIVEPRGTDLTISGAEAEQNGDDAFQVPFTAPLALRARPTCSVEVGQAPNQTVTAGEPSTDPVRWETSVELGGSGGCAGRLSVDDADLQQAIPGAQAAFMVAGAERLRINLSDDPVRVDLVVTAPRTAVLGLGPGERDEVVNLIAAPEGAELSPSEGVIDNGDNSFTLAVPLQVTVNEQPRAHCTLPTFAMQEVIADDAPEPPLEWSGEVACELSGGATVTLAVTGADDGLSAHFAAQDGPSPRSVALASGDPAPALAVQVDRLAAQDRGAGSREFEMQIQVRATPAFAALAVDGGIPGANDDMTVSVVAPVRIVPPAPNPEIALDPLDLTPDTFSLSTHDTSPDPLEARATLAVELHNGAEGTVSVDESALSEGVTAFFEVGGNRLSSPVPLAEQQGPIELVVRFSLPAAQALGPGEHEQTIPIVLDPQGAEVRAAGAAREGNGYRLTTRAMLSITTPPSVNLTTPAFDSQTISTVPSAGAEVSFAAPVPYMLNDDATITLRVDDAALRQQYPGADAGLSIDGKAASGSVALAENGRNLELLVTAPKVAFSEEGTFDLPVDLVAQGEDVVFSIDGAEIQPGSEARLSAVPQLTVSVPLVQISLGTWTPEVHEVASTGAGTEVRRWEQIITASGLEEGEHPSVNLALRDGALAESATLRLYANEVAEGNLLAEGRTGQPVTASFEPGRERLIVVIEETEDRLRALGLSDDHRLNGTLTIDPNGARAEIPGKPDQIREPTEEAFSVRARVYETFDAMLIIRPVGLGLLALLALLALIFLRPGLPASAGIEFDGNAPVPVAHGSTVGGAGATVNNGSNGFVGEIKGRVGGRLTGAAKFITMQPVMFNREEKPPGESIKIIPGDRITPLDGGSDFTYQN